MGSRTSHSSVCMQYVASQRKNMSSMRSTMHRKEGAQVEFNPKLSTIPWNQIRIEDKLYSTEKLANIHPGGPMFIKAFSGRDASQAFISYHRRPFPHNHVKD